MALNDMEITVHGSQLGLKVGQGRKVSALCVVERQTREDIFTHPERHDVVRFLERLPAGASFPEVAERVAEVCENVEKQTRKKPRIYMDATGLGEPVVKLVTKAAGCHAKPVFFNHGDRRVEDLGDVNLGKAYLVAHLQTLLQTGRLHLPKTDEARQLAHELLDYEVTVEPDANSRYGSFDVGRHDELVTALGLAVQVRDCGGGFWSVPARAWE